MTIMAGHTIYMTVMGYVLVCDEHAHYYSLRCHRLRNHRVLPIRCMCARRHLFTVHTINGMAYRNLFGDFWWKIG